MILPESRDSTMQVEAIFAPVGPGLGETCVAVTETTRKFMQGAKLEKFLESRRPPNRVSGVSFG